MWQFERGERDRWALWINGDTVYFADKFDFKEGKWLSEYGPALILKEDTLLFPKELT